MHPDMQHGAAESVTTEEAIEVCERWFAHNEQRKADTLTLQRAATLASEGQVGEARRLKSSVDRQPRVFDGARLEPAVKHLVSLARERA